MSDTLRRHQERLLGWRRLRLEGMLIDRAYLDDDITEEGLRGAILGVLVDAIHEADALGASLDLQAIAREAEDIAQRERLS